MSGICGWIKGQREADPANATLDTMRQALRDRDSAGPRPIVSGPCALAVETGVRPVSLHRTETLLAAVEGHVRWRSPNLAAMAKERGAASAVAEASRRHSSNCLNEMLGPCAIAVVETQGASGLLAIDRLGTRTMCYANPSRELVFASNTESVVAHPSVSPEVRQQAIFNYLYCHVVPSPGTIYRSVQKLRPGECATFKNGAVARRFYWRVPYHDRGTDPVDALERRLRLLLKDATRHAIDGEQAMGTFLSGGTDSSTIATMLTELTQAPARTYSIGFASDEFDEMKFARIAAQRLGDRK